ncbi:hypothetical protein BU16DRAFT_229353 [Lophium mytilinum]|uniref:Secreted protein n=1 Tax=Lophium mytilinum TaxID=390894 RepID=A0A6A6Q856_9PEZI|nr:hypothetical protein BU16DRAFT_229353 [Lophium mytilinum]
MEHFIRISFRVIVNLSAALTLTTPAAAGVLSPSGPTHGFNYYHALITLARRVLSTFYVLSSHPILPSTRMLLPHALQT